MARRARRGWALATKAYLISLHVLGMKIVRYRVISCELLMRIPECASLDNNCVHADGLHPGVCGQRHCQINLNKHWRLCESSELAHCRRPKCECLVSSLGVAGGDRGTRECSWPKRIRLNVEKAQTGMPVACLQHTSKAQERPFQQTHSTSRAAGWIQASNKCARPPQHIFCKTLGLSATGGLASLTLPQPGTPLNPACHAKQHSPRRCPQLLKRTHRAAAQGVSTAVSAPANSASAEREISADAPICAILLTKDRPLTRPARCAQARAPSMAPSWQ